MEQVGARLRLQFFGDVCRRLAALMQDDVAVIGAAAADDVGDIADFQQVQAGATVGHECPLPLDPAQPAIVLEFAQGAVHGHPAGAGQPDQFALRWDAMIDRPCPGQDVAADIVLDLLVERRRVGRVGGQRGCGSAHPANL